MRRLQRQPVKAPTWHEHRGELRTHPERVCGCGGRDLEATPAMVAQRLRGTIEVVTHNPAAWKGSRISPSFVSENQPWPSTPEHAEPVVIEDRLRGEL